MTESLPLPRLGGESLETSEVKTDNSDESSLGHEGPGVGWKEIECPEQVEECWGSSDSVFLIISFPWCIVPILWKCKLLIFFTTLWWFVNFSLSFLGTLNVGVVIWVRNALHSLGYLNNWSSAGNTLWEGFVVLLDEVSHWGWKVSEKPCLLLGLCLHHTSRCELWAHCSCCYA